MNANSPYRAAIVSAAVLAITLPGVAGAQPAPVGDGERVLTTVYGSPPTDLSEYPEGPELEGFISAREGNKVQITSYDGATSTVTVGEGTQIRRTSGLLGLARKTLTAESLLTGLPVEVDTVEWGSGLVAKKVRLKKADFKTAQMIQNGTSQRFNKNEAGIGENKLATERNAAAAEALRGRFGDIDQYNVKGTTNVYFDTGKANLSARARNELCSAAQQAEAQENALLLVVGYTDSTGSYELNQTLSEKRAGRVVNYLQQQCGWKPWRMLSPSGFADSDPTADNTTREGRAQNRRVAVNVLVSKSVDGM